MKTNPSPPITAVIPVFNEGERIREVVKVLDQVDYIHRLIIVDDGSYEESAKIIHEIENEFPDIRLLKHPTNVGKGGAIFTGIEEVQTLVVLLLDGDLINLNTNHIDDLVKPVVNSEVDMTIGIFKGGYWQTDLSHKLTPWLSGQRCLRTEILNDVSTNASKGYGFETALTVTAKRFGRSIRMVEMKGVSHPPGELPRGNYHGPLLKIKMYYQIIRAWALTSQQPATVRRLLRRVGMIFMVSTAVILSLFTSITLYGLKYSNSIIDKILNSSYFAPFVGQLRTALEFFR